MPSMVLTSELIAAMSIIISPLHLTRISEKKTTAALRLLVKKSLRLAVICMYASMHSGSYPAASPVLLPERFGIYG